MSCKTIDVPEQYLPKVSQVESWPYGSWVEMYLRSSTGDIEKSAGELIAFHKDSIFILDIHGALKYIDKSLVSNANLYKYKNLANTYMWLSIALFIPSVLGLLVVGEPAFLIFGVPGLLVGTILAISESSSKNYMLVYPGRNRLEEFAIYSRFPQGIPPTVDRNSLVPPDK